MRLRNFAIMMLFLDCGLRLDELVNLRISRVDFAVGEMITSRFEWRSPVAENRLGIQGLGNASGK